MAVVLRWVDHGIFAIFGGAPNIGPRYLGSCPNILGILQGGLTFLLLDSNACHGNTMAQVRGVTFEEQCTMSAGAKLSISATVFWLVAGITSYLEGKAWQSECEERNLPEGSLLSEAESSQANKPLANYGFLKRLSGDGGSMHSIAESQATDLMEPLEPSAQSADYGFLRRASSVLFSRNRGRVVPDGDSVLSEAEAQGANQSQYSANYGFLQRASSSAPSRGGDGATSDVGTVSCEAESQAADLTEHLAPKSNFGFLEQI